MQTYYYQPVNVQNPQPIPVHAQKIPAYDEKIGYNPVSHPSNPATGPMESYDASPISHTEDKTTSGLTDIKALVSEDLHLSHVEVKESDFVGYMD